MQKKTFFIPSAVLAIIAMIAFFMPFKIYINDALTLEKATDYGVKVQIIRIIFEPFLGPLLFFKRSLYALDDMRNVLIWLLLIFTGYSLYSLFLGKVASKKNYGLKQLANLPLVIGLWFAVFALIIFIDLPNNTIINNSKTGVLITTHAHTEYSHDGLITQQAQWNWHKRNGFDAFFITDHGNHLKTLEFIAQQQNGAFSISPFIMAGQEHSGSNHMSLLGLNGKFQTGNFPDSIVIDSVHYYGGAVIVNHWFDGKGEPMQFYKNLNVDGFEIENAGKRYFYDRTIYKKIKMFCEQNNLIMVGGLDFHGYGRACGIWNAFDIPNWNALNPQQKEQAVLIILRNRDQSKLKVLMYIDRLFYAENSFFSPFITFFYYLRTLNEYQVLSWFVWLVLFGFASHKKLLTSINQTWILPIITSLGALFMLVLGVNYYIAQQKVLDYTDVYQEYSNLLLPIGGTVFIYSLIVFYQRFKSSSLS